MYCQKGRMFMLMAVIVVVQISNQVLLADPITGSGTVNYIPMFNGSASITDSNIYESLGNIGIGTTSPQDKFHIYSGNLRVSGGGGLIIYDDHPGNARFQAVLDHECRRLTMMVNNWGSPTNPGISLGTTRTDGDAFNVVTGVPLTDGGHGIPNGNGTSVFTVKGNGKVGIGTTDPTEILTVRGNILIQRASDGTSCLELGEGLDYAEGFELSEPSKNESGSVLIIDSENPGKLTLSTKAYDTKVAGIAAGAKGLGSGVRLGVNQFDCDVALAGRVYCNVDATEYAIQPGDLLTTSNTPGYAMKAQDFDKAKGATLGKAMEGIEKGKKGQILVLVTLQ